jgi:hypothetical protein
MSGKRYGLEFEISICNLMIPSGMLESAHVCFMRCFEVVVEAAVKGKLAKSK